MSHITRRAMLKGVTAAIVVKLVGCGSSSSGGSFPSYNLAVLPLDNAVLTLGFSQIFSLELTALQDMFVDALVVQILASPQVDLNGVEVRDETTNTIGNSVIRFGSRPVYPFTVRIPITQFVPAGKKKAYVVFVDVLSFGRSNVLQAILVNIEATAPGGAVIPPMSSGILGPAKVSNA